MNTLANAHFWIGAAVGIVVALISVYGLLLVSEAEARIELMERRPTPYSTEDKDDEHQEAFI